MLYEESKPTEATEIPIAFVDRVSFVDELQTKRIEISRAKQVKNCWYTTVSQIEVLFGDTTR